MRASDEDPEGWAFRLVWIAAVALAVCVVVGVFLSVVVGVVLLAVACVAATVWVVASRSPDRSLRTAELEGLVTAPSGHAPRVLLVANEALDDRTTSRVLDGTGVDATIDVLAPVLQSRTHLVMTDVDAETAAARDRLETTLDCVRRQGFRASGRVGDAVDPLTGLQDELRLHAVSEVVVATHPDSHENWLEPEMLEALRAQLGIPVRRVVVGPR